MRNAVAKEIAVNLGNGSLALVAKGRGQRDCCKPGRGKQHIEARDEAVEPFRNEVILVNKVIYRLIDFRTFTFRK